VEEGQKRRDDASSSGGESGVESEVNQNSEVFACAKTLVSCVQVISDVLHQCW